MLMLSSVLVDDNTPIHVRNAAGLALKNGLTARVSSFLLLSALPSSCIMIAGECQASRPVKQVAFVEQRHQVKNQTRCPDHPRLE